MRRTCGFVAGVSSRLPAGTITRVPLRVPCGVGAPHWRKKAVAASGSGEQQNAKTNKALSSLCFRWIWVPIAMDKSGALRD
jgi:hypothetical protein